VNLRVPITYKLQGNELTITQAAKGDADSRMIVERMERTRVSRAGNQLRVEVLANPVQGQVVLLKKIG
jgi:hypothetical protein